MPLLSAKFIVTSVYAVVSIFFYVVEFFVILTNRKTFAGSFYTLYLYQGTLNIATYLNSLITIRLPQNTCRYCALSSFFNMRSFPGLQLFHTWHYQMAFVQYTLALVVTLNRTSMIIFPFTFDKYWKKYVHYGMVALILLPSSVTWIITFGTSSYAYSSSADRYSIKTTGYLPIVVNTMGGVMVLVTLLNLICNLYTAGRLWHHKSKNMNIKKGERHLAWYTFCTFIAEGFGTGVTICNIMVADGSPEKEVVQDLVPFFSDGMTLLPSVLLLVFSGSLREALKKKFIKHRSPTGVALS